MPFRHIDLWGKTLIRTDRLCDSSHVLTCPFTYGVPNIHQLGCRVMLSPSASSKSGFFVRLSFKRNCRMTELERRSWLVVYVRKTAHIETTPAPTAAYIGHRVYRVSEKRVSCCFVPESKEQHPPDLHLWQFPSFELRSLVPWLRV